MAKLRATRSLLSDLLLVCATAMVSTGVLAQSAGPAATAGSSSEAGGQQLQDIVVTATRREQTEQSVPISIDAFSSEDLAAGGIKNITDLAALTPGLQFAVPNGFSSAFTTIAIRGLNTNTGPPTVGLYLDDTVISSRLSGLANQGNAYPFVFDLNRVEVERGPQGTLFGAGAEAGTVRFITNQPSLTDYSGQARGEYASTEGGRPSYEDGVAVGGPIINDELGFRFSVWDRSDGGWVNRIDPYPGAGFGDVVAHNANTNDKYVIKGALAFKVGNFLVTPALYYQKQHQDDAQRFYAAFSNANDGIFNNAVGLPETWTDSFLMPSVKVEGQLPFATLTANASYFHRDVDEVLDEAAFVCPGAQTAPGSGIAGCGNPLGVGYLDSPTQIAYTPTNLYVRAYTAEVRLASTATDALVSWVAGLYYEHRQQRDFQTDYDLFDYPQAFAPPQFPPPAPGLFNSIIQDQHELFIDAQSAIFAQADIHLTNQLTLTVGERLAHVTIDGADTTGITALTGAPPYSPFHAVNNPVTPRLGLSYQFDHDNLAYVSFSEGYRPGGGNPELPNVTGPCAGVPQTPATYAPDYMHSLEVGAKDTALGSRLQVNTSVFYNQWHNIQQYISEFCGPYAYGTNAGNAVSDGFDLQLRALLTEQLRFDLNVGYVNAYYSSSGYLPGLPHNDANIVVREGDKVGILPQVNAPWNVNPSLNYSTTLSNGDKFHFQALMLYTSKNPGPFVAQNTELNGYGLEAPDPATHIYNMRAGLTVEKLDMSLFVNNLTNDTQPLSKYQNNGNSNLVSYTTFRPRTIGVTLNYAF
jgi:outer membrane receptor protein involved in Fe transport